VLHIWFMSCRMASVGLMHNLSNVTARRNEICNRLHSLEYPKGGVGTRGKGGHSLKESGDEGSRGA
jgi:hypothetical protein